MVVQGEATPAQEHHRNQIDLDLKWLSFFVAQEGLESGN